MAKFVCLLLCLAVLVNTGFSLKCYHCSSDKIDGCIKSASPKDRECGSAAPGLKSVCYYKHTYDEGKKLDIVNATCGSLAQNAKLESLGDCSDINKPLVKRECRVCDTDLCNSAPVFTTSLFALLCLPVMYFVTKFLL